MLTFIHTYTAASFPGLIKSGLWREGDGLKLMHKPGFTPPDDFNSIAAVGLPLERLLRELRCPFYIDRLQGGVGFTNQYAYDKTLLRHYRALLGERFLGFQMHEWASNFASDRERILALCEKEGVSLSDPAARDRFWDAVEAGKLPLFLEAFSAAEYRTLSLPEDLSAFVQAAEKLYALRAAQTEGLLFPADSYFMAPRIELKYGAKLLLPEMGWQIPDLRVQVAYTRGMARAARVPWGVYYECWQNTKDTGFTIPFSLREGQDEWLEDLLHKGNGSELPWERREHGGTSLSLMERAWRYAYFSGASCFGEEYGVCNTFRDLHDFSLSPYGEKKKEFLRFAGEFPSLGEPYTPFAVVLPAEMPMLDLFFNDKYLSYPAEDAACPIPPCSQEAYRAAIRTIFGRDASCGNYGHVLRCGGLPAVFDIIHADQAEALKQYQYLIDLTGTETLKKQYRNVVSPAQTAAILDGLLPCRVGDGLFSAYNRRENGWYALIMNNDGIFHDGFLPDVQLPEATVWTQLNTAASITAVKKAAGSGALHQDGGRYYLTLKAGEWLLLELA